MLGLAAEAQRPTHVNRVGVGGVSESEGHSYDEDESSGLDESESSGRETESMYAFLSRNASRHSCPE
jgi:hypothetical protein